MTTFRSCHRKLANDRNHVRVFLDADIFHWGGISTVFLKWSANISSPYYTHFGKNIKYFYSS